MNLNKTCAVESSGNTSCFDDSARQPSCKIFGSIVDSSMGAAHTCALGAEGFPFCFGSNSRGQLGSPNGNGVVNAQNQQINNMVMVVSGAYHSCVLIVDGTVYCWGDNTAGQMGTGAAGGFNDFASQVPGLSNIVAISAGMDPGANGLGSGSFTCALSATGAVSCWGAGGKGQLGNGSDTAAQPVAQAVFGVTNAVAIAAGGSHACDSRDRGSQRVERAQDLVRVDGAVGGDVDVPRRDGGGEQRARCGVAMSRDRRDAVEIARDFVDTSRPKAAGIERAGASTRLRPDARLSA